MDIIKFACWRATPQHAQTPSAELAALITAPRYFRRIALIEFFQQCVARGASTGDLRKIYQFGQYKTDVQSVLESTVEFVDLTTVGAMFALMPFDVSETTASAIAAVIASRAARLVDVVAAELGECAPAAVTAADVDAALGRVGVVAAVGQTNKARRPR